MTRPRLLRCAPRRGSSLLEMGMAITIMLVVVLSVWVIATGFWNKAVMESTAAVASLNAQSAYNRIRFAPGVNDARTAVAVTEALRAANSIINMSLTKSQADLMGLQSGCGAGAPTINTGYTDPAYVGTRIWRKIDITNNDATGKDVRITVQTRAQWTPVFLPRALLGSPTAGSGCVVGRGVAIARKP